MGKFGKMEQVKYGNPDSIWALTISHADWNEAISVGIVESSVDKLIALLDSQAKEIAELEARLELFIETEMDASRELTRYHAGTDDYSQIKERVVMLEGEENKLVRIIDLIQSVPPSWYVSQISEYITKILHPESSLLDGSEGTTAPIECEYCGGDGYHICDQCSGDGKVKNNELAMQIGLVFHDVTIGCSDCNGTGKQDCIICMDETTAPSTSIKETIQPKVYIYTSGLLDVIRKFSGEVSPSMWQTVDGIEQIVSAKLDEKDSDGDES